MRLAVDNYYLSNQGFPVLSNCLIFRDTYNSFNFSKLEFPQSAVKCPVLYNTRKMDFIVYQDNTDIESAEFQNPVVFVGYLTQAQAKNGKRPDVSQEEQRIKMHFTSELV